jgi:hypothetical protein
MKQHYGPYIRKQYVSDNGDRREKNEEYKVQEEEEECQDRECFRFFAVRKATNKDRDCARSLRLYQYVSQG